MERTFDIMRSFPEDTEDLAELPDHVEQLSIGRNTRGTERLDPLTGLRRLWVGGATLTRLEQVARLSHLKELVIAGAACATLPESWHLPKLRTLLLTRCARITSIESLVAMRRLETLSISSAKRLMDYGPLHAFGHLRTLELGVQQYYERQTIGSLSFLRSLRRLEYLTLHFSAVADGSLRPIAKLPSLPTLNLSNTFPREEFANLAAQLPKVTCIWFAGYTALGNCPNCGQGTMVMLTGKGQPSLCTVCDRTRFEKKLEEFRSLVDSSRAKHANRSAKRR
jgi:hypothetical protein